MEPEFSRAAVATLIAAIIGSVLDSGADAPELPRSLLQPPDEASPDVPLGFELLMQRFEFLIAEIEDTGVPARLSREYRNLLWMLDETMKYQAQFGQTTDRPN